MSHKMFNTLINLAACAILLAGQTVQAQEESTQSSSLSFTADSDDISADASGQSEPTKLYRPTHDRFNLHLGVGFVGGLGDDLKDNQYENMGIQGLVGFDVVLKEPLALSFQGGFNSLVAGDEANGITSAFIGAGFRLRFLADTNGALSEGGTIAGNLWLDAHFDYINHVYEDHGGYDVGLGYEFAFFKNINIGPYFRFQHVAIGDGIKYVALSGGLAMSIAGDTGPKDMDMDGIIDDMDSCPAQAEDPDNYMDEDGCPDPDNDEDGIMDADDECPEAAGIPEKNGCPETDNDNDGVLNDNDACVNDPEDKDGFQDQDGCPDPDNDGDGILDDSDQCIEDAEDKDGFQDQDGCPDGDNDADGIPDTADQCPNEAETKNGKEDEDGCPDLVRVVGDQIKILQKVYFATGKAKILDKSNELLNEVAAVIESKPSITVRVEGHTDDVGRDANNMKLSQERADAVKTYLIGVGVDESRLVAEGKGETAPISDNKTKEGRAQNRRVEFHILKTDVPSEESQKNQPSKETSSSDQPPSDQ